MNRLFFLETVIARELSRATAWANCYAPRPRAEKYAAWALADLMLLAIDGIQTQFGPYRQLYMNLEPRIRAGIYLDALELPVNMHRTIPRPAAQDLSDAAAAYSMVRWAALAVPGGYEICMKAILKVRMLTPFDADPTTLLRRVAGLCSSDTATLLLAAPLVTVSREGTLDEVEVQTLYRNEQKASEAWLSWYWSLFRDPPARA